jgi:hypothetical protein
LSRTAAKIFDSASKLVCAPAVTCGAYSQAAIMDEIAFSRIPARNSATRCQAKVDTNASAMGTNSSDSATSASGVPGSYGPSPRKFSIAGMLLAVACHSTGLWSS